MKIGVLGAGFGIVHIGAFQKHPLADEVVFFTRSAEKAALISGQFHVHGTTDIDEILSDPSVDVVSVALLPSLHARTAIRAMECGKDVICEIPVCLTLEEARELLAVSRKTGRRVLTDLFTRFRPAHRFIQEKIVSGEYGRLFSMQTSSKNAPLWGYHPLGLDVLPFEGCYCDFDFLYWCMGKPSFRGVAAVDRQNESCVIDTVMTAPGGISVQMSASSLTPIGYGMFERVEAVFDRAVVSYAVRTMNGYEPGIAELKVYNDAGCTAVELPQNDHYYDSLGYCLERIADGKPGITDLEEALPALEMVLELQRLL